VPGSQVAGQHARRLRDGGATRTTGVLRRSDPARSVTDRASHLAGGLIAITGVQRERDGVRELGADGGDQRVQRGGLLLLLLERELGERARLIWQAPGDELVG